MTLEQNSRWQHLTISILFLLNIFIKNLLITKSIEDICDLFNRRTSSPYRRTGIHTYRELLHRNFTHQILVKCKSRKFIPLSIEMRNRCCFKSWQAGSVDLIKIVSTNSIQDTANTVNVNTFLSFNKCLKCPPSAFRYSVNLFLKFRAVVLIGPAENCPISSATFYAQTVVGWPVYVKQCSLHEPVNCIERPSCA